MFPAGVAFGNGFVHEVIDAVAVLCMHHCDAAIRRRKLHSLEHSVVRHHHAPARVGHIHFEGDDPHTHHLRNLVFHIVVAKQNGVNGVVEIRCLRRLVHELPNYVRNRAFNAFAPSVRYERHDSRNATERRAQRKRLDAVRINGVVMRVNDARHDIQTRCVNHTCRILKPVLFGVRAYLAVLDNDVLASNACSANHKSPVNDVVCASLAHAVLSILSILLAPGICRKSVALISRSVFPLFPPPRQRPTPPQRARSR